MGKKQQESNPFAIDVGTYVLGFERSHSQTGETQAVQVEVEVTPDRATSQFLYRDAYEAMWETPTGKEWLDTSTHYSSVTLVQVHYRRPGRDWTQDVTDNPLFQVQGHPVAIAHPVSAEVVWTDARGRWRALVSHQLLGRTFLNVRAVTVEPRSGLGTFGLPVSHAWPSEINHPEPREVGTLAEHNRAWLTMLVGREMISPILSQAMDAIPCI